MNLHRLYHTVAIRAITPQKGSNHLLWKQRQEEEEQEFINTIGQLLSHAISATTILAIHDDETTNTKYKKILREWVEYSLRHHATSVSL